VVHPLLLLIFTSVPTPSTLLIFYLSSHPDTLLHVPTLSLFSSC